ncbi:efflux RND transporter periplasmic adaptor subunit [Algoriphagus sp. AGSA1]|uniref:efflux RND transporter periplasmic adaptor subunit n=1 Tax=Algoriphagus sp. AGSA1 TaxID=2907213 RepID=UPI001F1A9F97|nr:efflux RND transporter periplasmic adaptor subunit [Algoriphagus sp. AGSA1]MCE7055444.1 efflux RND transporter periplasmic adaptor subunit [Algoriphagus sp. AGSA1]
MQQLSNKFIAVALAASLGTFSCSKVPEQTKEKPTNFCLNDTFKSKVGFYEVSLEPIVEKLHLTGSVETNPDHVLSFIPLVSGIITNTYFSIGDEVKKGQVLAELKSTELISMQSEQKSLNSQLKVTTKRLESAKSMYESGISSEKDLLEAESELDVLNTELERVTNNLNLFSPSEERGVFQIKSPVSGIITDKYISGGTQISSEGDPLFTISNLEEIWIMANIYASNISHIEKGMPAEVRTLSYKDLTLQGEVSVISQVLDTESKVLKARIVLKNTDLKLKPGMLVDVYLSKGASGSALAVPMDNLIFDSNRYFALVYRNDCSIEVRAIDIMSKNEGIAYIKEGLNEGEQILSTNNLLVYEQLKNFQD